MKYITLTPNLTCNGIPVNLNKEIWFEIGVERVLENGEEETYSVCQTEDFREALIFYRDYVLQENEKSKFIDVWGIPVNDNVPYPIDQFAWEDV